MKRNIKVIVITFPSSVDPEVLFNLEKEINNILPIGAMSLICTGVEDSHPDLFEWKFQLESQK